MRVNEQMFYNLLSKNFNLPCIESQIRRLQSQKHTINQWHLIFITTKTQSSKLLGGPSQVGGPWAICPPLPPLGGSGSDRLFGKVLPTQPSILRISFMQIGGSNCV